MHPVFQWGGGGGFPSLPSCMEATRHFASYRRDYTTASSLGALPSCRSPTACSPLADSGIFKCKPDYLTILLKACNGFHKEEGSWLSDPHTVSLWTSLPSTLPSLMCSATSAGSASGPFNFPFLLLSKFFPQNFTWLPLPHHPDFKQIASFQQGPAHHPQEFCTLLFHTTPYSVHMLSSPWCLSMLKLSCCLFFSPLSIPLFMSRMSVLFTTVSSVRGSPGSWWELLQCFQGPTTSSHWTGWPF